MSMVQRLRDSVAHNKTKCKLSMAGSVNKCSDNGVTSIFSEVGRRHGRKHNSKKEAKNHVFEI